MKKKVLAVILGVSMVMSMAACGGSSDSAKENEQMYRKNQRNQKNQQIQKVLQIPTKLQL